MEVVQMQRIMVVEDDFDIQEVPIKKETSNSKKKNTIKYEKITLEDILNDDEF